MINNLERAGVQWRICSSRAPNPEQRIALQDRYTAVTNWLSAAGPEITRVEISALFSVMNSRSGSNDDRRRTLEIYVHDLQDIPFFALRSACRSFRLGLFGDGKFVPSPGELRIKSEDYCRSLRNEQAQLHRVLQAKVVIIQPYTPEHRSEVLAQVRSLLRELNNNSAKSRGELRQISGQIPPYRMPTQSEAQDLLNERLARLHEIPPVQMSDVLRKKLGLTEEGR